MIARVQLLAYVDMDFNVRRMQIAYFGLRFG